MAILLSSLTSPPDPSPGRTHPWPERRGGWAELGRVVVQLAADGRSTLRAEVIVLGAGRQDQEELFSHRHRLPAAGAEKACRLEFLVTRHPVPPPGGGGAT